MFNKKKKTDKSAAATAFSVYFGYVLWAALGVLLISLMVQFSDLRSKLHFIDGLQESQNAVVEQVGLSQEYLTQFATDLNQIRAFLLLPETDYDFSDLGQVDLEEPTEDITTQIFDFVQTLGEAEANSEYFQTRKSAIQDYLSVSEIFLNSGVTVDPVGVEGLEAVEWTVTDDQTGEEIITISLAYDAVLDIDTTTGAHGFSPEIEFSMVMEAIEEFMGNLESVRTTLVEYQNGVTFLENELFPSESFQSYLNAHSLLLSNAAQGTGHTQFTLSNGEGTVVASFQVWQSDATTMLMIPNPVEGFAEEKWIDISLNQAGIDLVVSSLESLVDPRTVLEIKVDERREELAQLMGDRGFMSTLKAVGLSMGELVEEEGRLYYPILNGEGEVLRNLILDFNTGELSVEMPESGITETLTMATWNLTQTGKKKLSTYLS